MIPNYRCSLSVITVLATKQKQNILIVSNPEVLTDFSCLQFKLKIGDLKLFTMPMPIFETPESGLGLTNPDTRSPKNVLSLTNSILIFSIDESETILSPIISRIKFHISDAGFQTPVTVLSLKKHNFGFKSFCFFADFFLNLLCCKFFGSMFLYFHSLTLEVCETNWPIWLLFVWRDFEEDKKQQNGGNSWLLKKYLRNV